MSLQAKIIAVKGWKYFLDNLFVWKNIWYRNNHKSNQAAWNISSNWMHLYIGIDIIVTHYIN